MKAPAQQRLCCYHYGLSKLLIYSGTVVDERRSRSEFSTGYEGGGKFGMLIYSREPMTQLCDEW